MNAQKWDGLVSGPGLYLGVPAAEYHNDPCPAPSLSNSIAKIALFQSLQHARAAHPQLREGYEELDGDDEPQEKYNRLLYLGSAAHSLAFGFGAAVVPLDVPDWKKGSAREARDAIIEGGEIPLTARDYKIAKRMASIAGPVITDLLEGSLVAEAMIVTQENGFWRRGLVDRMRADARIVIDYKTTGMIASPVEACDMVASRKHYFQEAFYRRLLDNLDPDGRGRRRFVFLVQEQQPPFTLTLIETDEAYRTLGDEQVDAACNRWDRALIDNEWPGYPIGPHIASPKPWLLENWARRSLYDETLNPPVMEPAE